tara:strand:- start:2233 stop:2484 length:252 start_codon:yes stop_codon:yes gene_type:complete
MGIQRLSPVPKRARERMRRRRKKMGISLAALADRLGTSNVNLSRIENGLRGSSVKDLRRWGHALGFKLKIYPPKVSFHRRDTK